MLRVAVTVVVPEPTRSAYPPRNGYMSMTPPALEFQIAGPLTSRVLPSEKVSVATKVIFGVADRLNGPVGEMVT